MIMISESAYIIPPIIIAILLLMIVYVGIGRASLLINIVRFDLGRPAMRKNKFVGQDTATPTGKVAKIKYITLFSVILLVVYSYISNDVSTISTKNPIRLS